MGCGSGKHNENAEAKPAGAQQQQQQQKGGSSPGFITVLPPNRAGVSMDPGSPGGDRASKMMRTHSSINGIGMAHRRRISTLNQDGPDGVFAEDIGTWGKGDVGTPLSPLPGIKSVQSANKSMLGMSRMMSAFHRDLVGYMGSRDTECDALAIDEDDKADEGERSEERLRNLFDALDTRKTGKVSLIQLQKGWKKLGWAHSEKALKQMFRLAAGSDGACDSGYVDRAAFNKFFRELASVDDLRAWDPDNDEWLETRVVKRPKRGREYAWGARMIKGYSVDCHLGYPSRVKSISADPCRPLYASCHCGTPTLEVHEAETGATLRSYNGHRDTIMSVGISPDLKVLATGSRDADVILWELVTGHVLHTIKHSGVMTSLAFSHDGKFLVTGGADAVIRRYKTDRGKLKAASEELGLGVVVTVAHGDGLVAASLSGQFSVHLLHEKNLQVRKVLHGHSSSVWSLQFSEGRDAIRREKLGRKEAKSGEARDKCEAARLLSTCKEFIKVWEMNTNCSVLHSFTPPPVGAGGGPGRRAQPGAGAVTPLLGAPVGGRNFGHHIGAGGKKMVRRWICTTWLGGDFAHFIAASLSDYSVYLLREPPHSDCCLVLNTRASVYTMSAPVEQNEIFCGDELGNVYRIQIW